MQKSIELSWKVIESTNNQVVIRHCKNCGKTVEFKDSLIRRHNANGKYIYRFAIYKCDKNHTWNQKLSIYKAFTEHVRVREEEVVIDEIELAELDVKRLANQGINLVNIKIAQVRGTSRLDKILAERIQTWSRSEIVKKIEGGTIQINNANKKASQKLSVDDLITIIL